MANIPLHKYVQNIYLYIFINDNFAIVDNQYSVFHALQFVVHGISTDLPLSIVGS